jgi:hypothetical protein
MRRLLILAVVLPLALGACQAGSEPTASEPTPPTASPSPEPPAAPSRPAETEAPDSAASVSDECGADKVSGRWLNALPTADAKADIAAKVGDRPIRYYTQGDSITLDFNAARLNVELGADGRIKVFRCG